VFTARYGLIPYMKHVTFRPLKVNGAQRGFQLKMKRGSIPDKTPTPKLEAHTLRSDREHLIQYIPS
jgi:hypothetical protein